MIEKNLKKQKVKKIHERGDWQRNTPDFHIVGIEKDTLVELQNGGLDDIDSFNCDMYNFGDMDNLPDSDRAMISKNQTCREYRH